MDSAGLGMTAQKKSTRSTQAFVTRREVWAQHTPEISNRQICSTYVQIVLLMENDMEHSLLASYFEFLAHPTCHVARLKWKLFLRWYQANCFKYLLSRR
jgi:hypothetical protein